MSSSEQFNMNISPGAFAEGPQCDARMKKRKAQVLVCTPCGVEVNSQAMWESHINGQRHAKKMRLLEASNHQNAGGDSKVEDASHNADVSILQKLNDFARFHRLQPVFDLINESGPPHQKTFEIRLSIGEESFLAHGTSIKKAQQAAAELALGQTKLEIPTQEQFAALFRSKRPTANVNNPKDPRQTKRVRYDDRRQFRPPPPQIEDVLYRHLTKRLDEITPKDEQMRNMQKTLIDVEKALKSVSDKLVERCKEKGITVNPTYFLPEAFGNNERREADDEFRMLKGVMRVGNVAKNVFLRSDTEIELVLLCANKPSVSLLDEISVECMSYLESDKFKIETKPDAACMHIKTSVDGKEIIIIVYLSSVVFRDENFDKLSKEESEKFQAANPDPADVLPASCCLHALAEVRHAKWFQVALANRANSVKVLRLVRDLIKRKPEPFGHLSQWCYELILNACSLNNVQNPPLGWIFRKFFEILSSGIILPGGLGIFDPCEKETVNAAAKVPVSSLDAITAECQTYLRCIAFRKPHILLDMEYIPDGFKTSDASTNEIEGDPEEKEAIEEKRTTEENTT